MNVKELREYLAEFPDAAQVEVIVDNHPVDYSMAWGGDGEGGSKATAELVAFVVAVVGESAEREG